MTVTTAPKTFVRCPNCRARFSADPSAQEGKVLICPTCSASILVLELRRTPNHVKPLAFGVALYFVMPLYLFIASSSSRGPASLMIGAGFLVLFGLFPLAFVVVYVTDPGIVMQLPASRPKCPRCGRRLVSQNSTSCPSCNPTSAVSAVRETMIDAPFTQIQVGDVTSKTKPVRICLVCDLEMNLSEALAVCPHCANIFHKSHLVQWVRLKRHCPVCGERLGEREIVAVSNEESMEGDS